MMTTIAIYRIVGDFAGSLMTRRSPHPLRLENFGASVVTCNSRNKLSINYVIMGSGGHYSIVAGAGRGEGVYPQK